MSADDDKAPEPHPLPLTRQWVEDYKKYGTDPKPEYDKAMADWQARRREVKQ